MKILAISTFLPFPLDQGDPIRVSMLSNAVEDIAELTFLSITRPRSKPSEIGGFYQQSGPHSFAILSTERLTCMTRVQSSLSSLLRCTPLWISDRFNSGISEVVKSMDSRFDAVILIGEAAGCYSSIAATLSSRVIWDKANILGPSTLSNLTTSRNPKSIARNALNAPLALGFERRILRSVDEVWVTTADEGLRLRRWYGRSADAVIPSAVEFRGNPKSCGVYDSKTIVSMGTLSYQPNWQGLRKFIREAGPILEQNGFTLRVLGQGASSSQKSWLEKHSFVELLGYVTNLSDALVGAKFGLAALWTGAGLKLKTLTFLSYGLPVLATPVAMEGIPSEAAFDVSSTPTRLALTAVASLASEDYESRLHLARALVAKDFSSTAFRASVANTLLRETK